MHQSLNSHLLFQQNELKDDESLQRFKKKNVNKQDILGGF